MTPKEAAEDLIRTVREECERKGGGYGDRVLASVLNLQTAHARQWARIVVAVAGLSLLLGLALGALFS